MKKRKKDPTREDRIHNQAIVDAYGPEERAMVWYYYLENQLRFPFQARCTVSKVVSPLSKGEPVQVLRMAPEEACSADVLVLIRWQGRTLAVPLSQLAAVKVDESTANALRDWHYWVSRGYLF
jgi:Calcium binding